jgi:fucose permease
MMVVLGVAAGLGAGAIDAGLNTYVAAHFGDGVMQWLHASFGVGITLGPIIMTVVLTRWSAWRLGYIIVGVFQLLLAVGFALTLPLWNRKDDASTADEPTRLTDYRTPIGETLRKPRVWLSFALFFIYVGCEMALGTWAFSLLTISRGIDAQTAGLLTGSYWGMFTVGRVIAGVFAKRLGVDVLMQGSLLGALLGALLLWWDPAPAANLVAVGVIGFAIAPVFPALMSGTSARVGVRFAANTIGMQMVATGLGSATISTLFGVLARRISLEVIPVCLVFLFLLDFLLYRLAMRRSETTDDG